MTRFVVVASLKRGAIEPAEVLDDANQQIAISRYEADENGLGETVVWQAGMPCVVPATRKLAMSERLPRISNELRASLCGRAMQFDDESALERERRERRNERRRMG